MSTQRESLHTLIDQMPESELPMAERFLQFLSVEPIGPHFAASLRRGIAQANEGEAVACRTVEEMVDRILGDDGP